ncbi:MULTISPECIES: spore germination protein [unclassified Paenibacillus]|uniref:spore germination protein n=1 Tax=unclassified Paenibacillus TaxID=185978 RepID=UPI0027871594|nr:MULTISPECIES: spore germination protein [unclassified Paenibacillus]MDQ0900276.1 spore germination protein [Paenibacillus sp. V4I7]MDQ0921212.1 spore germination protein [Paenibacillus sp. V4I5]
MFKQLFGRRNLTPQVHNQTNTSTSTSDSSKPLSSSLQENLATIQTILHHPSDLLIRQFTISKEQYPCALVSIDGLVDIAMINEQLLSPMLHSFDRPVSSSSDLLNILKQQILTAYELNTVELLDDALMAILSGDTLLLINNLAQCIIISSCGWKTRSIEEPQTESIIRGPRAGFTEDIRTNTALLRRRIKETNLVFDTYQIGQRSRREVVVTYIADIVHPDLVKEVTRRIKSIDIDDIEGSGYLEQWITDSFLSPFPLIMNTERPDRVSGALLQGRVAILVDGDPFVLILPITFASSLQSPEDYYQHWLISTLTRVLRLISAFIATFLPAIYIALLEFHHGMIPSKLAFSIAGAREGVPFPAVVEAFAMEFTLELLREAGLRLPKPIGQTIGIVGGLVIGESAVAAGIVNPVMVIVVAVTAISSFSLPSYSFAISLRVMRFSIMLAAAFLGLYGIILGYIMINIHLVNLKSFGIPYSTPFAPLLIRDWKDLILRSPLLFVTKRPNIMQTKNDQRMKGRRNRR